MRAFHPEKSEFHPRDRWLIAAFIGAPSAWMLHLIISYSLVPESCERKTKLMLHVVTLLCAAIAAVAGVIAWRIRATCQLEPASAVWKERTKWTATMTLVLAISMVVVIIAQEIPNLLLRSCD